MSIIQRIISLQALQWLLNVRDKIYMPDVEEYVPSGLRSHVFMMRVTGIWPVATVNSSAYKWLTIVIFTVIGTIMPLSMFINVLFAHSMQEAMDYTFALTGWATTVKAGVLYWHGDSIRHIFRIHAKLLRGGQHNANNERIANLNLNTHLSFSVLYFCCLSGLATQTFISLPEHGIFPSTAHFSEDIAKYRMLYWLVLMYQILSGLIIINWTATQDTFYIALINIICGHVADLKQRLVDLGKADASRKDLPFYEDIVECCKRYENCLRFDLLFEFLICSHTTNSF